MQGPPSQSNCVRFSTFEADFHTGELRKNGIRVRIQSKPLAVLFALIERPGELVSREELYKALWSDETFVDFDKNLSIAVKSRLISCEKHSAIPPPSRAISRLSPNVATAFSLPSKIPALLPRYLYHQYPFLPPKPGTGHSSPA